MCGDVEVDEDDDDDDDDNVYEESDDEDVIDKLEELFSNGSFLSPKQNVHTIKFADLSINLFRFKNNFN